jgi:hypothetical protein
LHRRRHPQTQPNSVRKEITMTAIAAAFAAILADPNLSAPVVWDPKDGGPVLGEDGSLRGIFAERPRPGPLRDPRDQPHAGPTLRVAVTAFEPTREGRISLNGRVFKARHWDRSRDGASWLIELEERA